MKFTEASQLYENTWKSYLQELEFNPVLSLARHCRNVHVNYNGMTIWMGRHDISVAQAKKERVEKSGSLFPLVPKDGPVFEHVSRLYGISVTFNSGTTITIKEGDASGLVDLIMTYERKDGEPCTL